MIFSRKAKVIKICPDEAVLKSIKAESETHKRNIKKLLREKESISKEVLNLKTEKTELSGTIKKYNDAQSKLETIYNTINLKKLSVEALAESELLIKDKLHSSVRQNREVLKNTKGLEDECRKLNLKLAATQDEEVRLASHFISLDLKNKNKQTEITSLDKEILAREKALTNKRGLLAKRDEKSTILEDKLKALSTEILESDNYLAEKKSETAKVIAENARMFKEKATILKDIKTIMETLDDRVQKLHITNISLKDSEERVSNTEATLNVLKSAERALMNLNNKRTKEICKVEKENKKILDHIELEKKKLSEERNKNNQVLEAIKKEIIINSRLIKADKLKDAIREYGG